VIKNLHTSNDISFIKKELLALDFRSRNILNVLHSQTKLPIPIFFVDLELEKSNPDILNLTSLCYPKIKVEAPHVRKDTPQCLRYDGCGYAFVTVEHVHTAIITLDVYAEAIPTTHPNV